MVTLCLVNTALCGYPLCSVLLWAAMVVTMWSMEKLIYTMYKNKTGLEFGT